MYLYAVRPDIVRVMQEIEAYDGGKTIPKSKPTTAQSDADIAKYVGRGIGKNTEKQKDVKAEKQKSVSMTHLTIDLPQEDHLNFKVASTLDGVKVVDEIQSFIQQRTSELKDQ